MRAASRVEQSCRRPLATFRTRLQPSSYQHIPPLHATLPPRAPALPRPVAAQTKGAICCRVRASRVRPSLHLPRHARVTSLHTPPDANNTAKSLVH
eukprot:505102-Pleurochrysis_carterae.AAC.1